MSHTYTHLFTHSVFTMNSIHNGNKLNYEQLKFSYVFLSLVKFDEIM